MKQMSYMNTRHPARQAAGIIGVVVIHLVVIYALATGLGRQVIEIIQKPLDTRIIDEVKAPPPPPPAPPPPPKMAPPPQAFIPLPEINVRIPPPTPNAITAVTTVKPPEPVVITRAPEVAAAPPVRVGPVINAKSCEQPEYPPQAVRLGQSGIVELEFLVDVDGSALDSRVKSSSGFPRLDDAARKALQLCKFKPATEDGKSIKAWGALKYEWKLQ